MIFLLNGEGMATYQSYSMSGKEGSKLIPKATASSDILYLVGQGNFILIREKSGKSQGILISVSVATM